MNLASICESDSANLNQLKKQINSELRVNTLAVVTSVDTGNKTLCAQPIIKENINTRDGKSKAISLPEIKNIYYIFSNKTPKIDDYCILLHLDRSPQGLKLNNKYDKKFEIISNGNKHSLSDAVAIVAENQDESAEIKEELETIKEELIAIKNELARIKGLIEEDIL